MRRFFSAAPGAFAHVKKVAVIGGGVAGLNAARALAAGGFKTVLFESAAEVGGVWRSNYSGFGLQVPRNLYEFLDFPFEAVPAWEYPTGAQVQAYIRAFAARFVQPVAEVRTHTAVEALASRGDGARGWAVTARTAGGAPAAPEDFDFVVMATGLYCTPSVPTLPNDGFAGAVVHSTAFTDASAAKGKHVVVLGGGKSALDCAVAAADAGAASTTLLSRVRAAAAPPPPPPSRSHTHTPRVFTQSPQPACRLRTGARPVRSRASSPFSLCSSRALGRRWCLGSRARSPARRPAWARRTGC